MTRRRLSPDEQALWTALARTVRPIRRAPPPAPVPVVAPPPIAPFPPHPKPKSAKRTKQIPPPPPPPPVRTPVAVLDTAWERRIRNGAMVPDMSIDLHGHTLSAAHARLNQAIADAFLRDARVLLVVTGKPPKATGAAAQGKRGAIRGEIGHWLETSAHADRIASVRVAHPRHGGDGALYLILRRKK
ncbi:Smr/MutS family protein [Sphingobium sp.]|uniref:Smr/MutS family protein n=1 Tax=Sphingobium sp. TaxID=1912891 RepID=UPI003BB63248